MITTRLTKIVFSLITLITLTLIIATANKIDCNDPATWSTSVGVETCAINGGK